MTKTIKKVSNHRKIIEVGTNNVARIEFYKHETGGTSGPFDIYMTYDDSGQAISPYGFFVKDGTEVEYQEAEQQHIHQMSILDFINNHAK